ncbi:hypothetical protein H5A46_10105 [Pectobacterium versatile]|uniref:hypothetical protein n=1 Tax=Pectobacterium versatile TaxID=2488639 RepID=UPI0019690A51|nr:hypothetical protein [Pectobacterium versatile]MBN3237692.1 hypothetical protein [Pectobacterium versatile]
MKTINDTRLDVIGFGSVPASVDEQREMAREIRSLRTQLATLEKQEPFAWTDAEELRGLAAHKCAYLYKIDPDNPYHDPRRQIMIYRGPVPQAVSQPCALRWRYRADEHSGASKWEYIPMDRADDFINKVASKDSCVEYGYVCDSQLYAVPDEMPETPDEDAEVDAYNKGKTDGWNAYRATMLKAGDA